MNPSAPAGPDFAWVLFGLGVLLTLLVAVIFVWLMAKGGRGGDHDRT